MKKDEIKKLIDLFNDLFNRYKKARWTVLYETDIRAWEEMEKTFNNEISSIAKRRDKILKKLFR